MKKLILLLLTVSLNTYIFAQEIPQLELKQTGIERIVVEVEGKTTSELYSKALNWVQETYKNPEKVLKMKIENQKIRLDGFSGNSWYVSGLGTKTYFDTDYSIEVSFKDGKYKFDYIINKFSKDGKIFSSNYKFFWKKNGTIRKTYVKAVNDLNKEMNSLSQSLYEYVSGKTQKKKDDW